MRNGLGKRLIPEFRPEGANGGAEGMLLATSLAHGNQTIRPPIGRQTCLGGEALDADASGRHDQALDRKESLGANGQAVY